MMEIKKSKIIIASLIVALIGLISAVTTIVIGVYSSHPLAIVSGVAAVITAICLLVLALAVMAVRDLVDEPEKEGK